MAVAGRKPKAADQKRNRNPSAVDWVEVKDVPYTGPRPKLPEDRVVLTRQGQTVVDLQEMTYEWWDDVSTMPHCILWTQADWRFAITTAMVADAAFCGIAASATELRNREKVLGTTAEFRRDLRIRYVPDVEPTTSPDVTSLDDYRDL